jgi:hypothetical protein
VEQENLNKEIFKEELLKLRNKGFISDIDYVRVKGAYLKYCEGQEKGVQGQGQKQKQAVKPTEVGTHKPVQDKSRPVLRERPKPSTRPRPMLSPDQIRERNITWSLNLGVIFILIAGLVIATSNWEVMSSVMKTTLIVMVSISFFAISYLADRVLKIAKTSLAFWVLGSLFLPVSILSIGFFKLLGHWLSITGEGRFVLGILGAALCLPVYVYSTYKYRHRVFSWISLITLSAVVIFILKAAGLSVDFFFLGIVLYNAALLMCQIRFKDNERLSLFIREMDIFSQVNLIISTLFLLGFRKNHTLYGFNIILTSIIYVFIMYSRKKREYSFVFSILLVYGIYEVVQSTALASMDVLLFTCIGFIFAGVGAFFKEEKKIFQFISGFVSFCSFIYLGYVFFFLQSKTLSPLVLTIGCILVFINYLILSNMTGERIFSYAAPVFLVAAGNQSYSIINPLTSVNFKYIYLSLLPLAIFLVFYSRNNWKYLKQIKYGTAIAVSADLIIKMLQALLKGEFGGSSLYFYVFTVLLLMLYLDNKKSFIGRTAKWSIPSSLFFSTMILYGKLYEAMELRKVYPVSLHMWMAVVSLILISMALYKFKHELGDAFFWTGNILLPLSIILLVLFYNKPIVLILTLGVYLNNLYRTKDEWQRLLFLVASFLVITLITNSIFRQLKLSNIWDQYIFFVTAMIIALSWFAVKGKWRRLLLINLIPFATLSTIIMNSQADYSLINFLFTLINILIMLYSLHEGGWQVLGFVPLVLATISFNRLEYIFNKDWQIIFILLALYAILIAVSRFMYKQLYGFDLENRSISKTSIDWYTVFALVNAFAAFNHLRYDSPLYLKLIPPVMIIFLLYLQIARVHNDSHKKVLKTLTILSLMMPYYTITYNVNIPDIIATEALLLPAIPITFLLTRKVLSENGRPLETVEFLILTFVSAVLLKKAATSGNITEGIILGGLALSSVIAGMQLRIKSFFFIGTVTLLLNLIFQTRDFWGNLPWWSYLLIVGLILISVASINELQNNNLGKEKKINREKLKKIFKDWN